MNSLKDINKILENEQLFSILTFMKMNVKIIKEIESIINFIEEIFAVLKDNIILVLYLDFTFSINIQKQYNEPYL